MTRYGIKIIIPIKDWNSSIAQNFKSCFANIYYFNYNPYFDLLMITKKKNWTINFFNHAAFPDLSFWLTEVFSYRYIDSAWRSKSCRSIWSVFVLYYTFGCREKRTKLKLIIIVLLNSFLMFVFLFLVIIPFYQSDGLLYFQWHIYYCHSHWSHCTLHFRIESRRIWGCAF